MTKCSTQQELFPAYKSRKIEFNFNGGEFLAYFDHRITNGVSEGINNKIKVLKRRSYGFHDDQYFFLKILNITGALPPLEALEHPRF